HARSGRSAPGGDDAAREPLPRRRLGADGAPGHDGGRRAGRARGGAAGARGAGGAHADGDGAAGRRWLTSTGRGRQNGCLGAPSEGRIVRDVPLGEGSSRGGLSRTLRADSVKYPLCAALRLDEGRYTTTVT